jgi:hypothetical protein
MTYRIPALFGVALLIGAFVSAEEPIATPEPEVLTRGPIHEAYAAAMNLSPAAGQIAPKAPPDNIDELPPDQKPEGDNVQWIPGYFAWDEDRGDFLWVSGFWRQPPPGRQWVPGGWQQTAAGWQWTSGFWADVTHTQVEYIQQPPPTPLETAPVPPPTSGQNTFVPGTWVWYETRYVWRPGFWLAYRPGWIYVPAHYCWTPVGYVFVDGYWDYPLRQRGIIFAPVYFGVGIYTRPAYVYRPSFVIYDEALYGALFVRTGYGAYYFGDYFEARYARFGYRSWIDIRIGGGFDPMYGYYRYHYASNPTWSITLTNTYAGRYRGDIPRPPRTFVQQNVVVNNITNNNTTVINNVNVVKNVTMVAPLSKVDKSAVAPLRPVTQVEQTHAIQAAKEVKQASVQRVKLETQAAATHSRPPAGQPAQPLKLQLPQTPVVNAKPATQQPPPPTHPKEVQKDQHSKEQLKGQPVTPVQPKDHQKDTPKSPPPLPKEQPKEVPKSPSPAPKEQPKKDQPKSGPPQDSTQHNQPPQSQPQQKAPAPAPPPPPQQPQPQHKTPPPQSKEKEKEKDHPKGG